MKAFTELLRKRTDKNYGGAGFGMTVSRLASLAGVGRSNLLLVLSGQRRGLETRVRLFPYLTSHEIETLGWQGDYNRWRYAADPGAGGFKTKVLRDCPGGCSHTQEQHEAFDAGAAAGRRGQRSERCPYKDGALRQVWMIGHSVTYRRRKIAGGDPIKRPQTISEKMCAVAEAREVRGQRGEVRTAETGADSGHRVQRGSTGNNVPA